MDPLSKPDTLLRQAAQSGDPGAFQSLVAATYNDAWTWLGGDAKALSEVYGTMFARLGEVGPRTEFWLWFEQISGPPREDPTDSPPDGLLDILRRQAVQASQKPRNSPGIRLARLTLSGWVPAFGSLLGLAWSFPTAGPESGLVKLSLSLVVALIFAGPFAFVFGPCLSSWRRALHRRAFWYWAVILSLLTLLWSWFCLSLLDNDLLINSHDWVRYLSKSMVSICDALGPMHWATAVAFSIAASFVGRRAVLKHSWVLYGGDSHARRLPGLAIMVLLLLLLVYGATIVAPVIAEGWQVEAPIQEAYSHLDSAPPEEVFILSARPEATVETHELWNKETDKLWKGEFWKDEKIQALVESAPRFNFAARGPQEGPFPEQMEVALRVKVVRPHHDNGTFALQYSMKNADLPSSVWDRWINIALARKDLGQGAPINDQLVAQSLARSYRSLLHQEAVDYNPLFPRSFYGACRQRQQLNLSWRHYQESKPYPDGSKAWSKYEFREVGSKNAQNPIPRLERALKEETGRHRLVELVLLMELKRLQSAGQKLPTHSSELRPEIRALAEAYNHWFELAPAKSEVQLRILDPNGKVIRVEGVASNPKATPSDAQLSLPSTKKSGRSLSRPPTSPTSLVPSDNSRLSRRPGEKG